MIIRTETYRDLEEDVATLFDVDETFILQKLNEFDKECMDGIYADYDRFQKLVDDFIDEYASLNIDDIYVYHLARNFSEPMELKPLKELLLSQNPFSGFLDNKGISFKEKDGQLEFLYKNRIVTPQEILSAEHCHLLARRLGYLGEADFCVNGFAFWLDIEKTSDGYYAALQRGPEVIENMERFLGNNMLDEYRRKTNYYGIVFKVPLSEVIFDKDDRMTELKDKARYFLRYALYTLHGCYQQAPSSWNNLTLRIRDDKMVKVDHCILIEE